MRALIRGLVTTLLFLTLMTALGPPQQAIADTTDTLAAGQQLGPGQALWSKNGLYDAVMQGDGNFVVYGPHGAMWASNTLTGNGTIAVMQGDGNLVVIAPGGQPVWASNSTMSYGDHLIMQDDGNLVVYSSGWLDLWASSSGLSGNHQDTLATGRMLSAGVSIVSMDGRYTAVMQADGNFVEYGPGGAVWASNTLTGNGTLVNMQSDGNMVVYAPGWQAVYASNTTPSSGDRLVLQSDGNLVIYDGSGRALWAQGALTIGSGPAVNDYPAQWRDAAQDSLVDTWREYNRECTSFAAWRLHARDHFEMPFNDNAINWGSRARALGYRVDGNPTVGSIAWSTAGTFGHVAWVQAVNGATITIEDYNSDYTGHWAVHYNVPATAYQYIHFAI